ncbi:6-phosphogluconate dehydrogenase, decarboxylating [Annulohypoxylon maeteangense]|uniref:6-phosphogluconate dehydrogenase, decarboxylating n=1 Tax=Annulohypoxylon maeteangense TaxID=1927788 RepID=UPI0020085763|nr:6-phosphogluconate dehydrogenase, decarboxylating [Annulohypoxylon maeteangense]KAI0883753.1 6-phosphogluconate dehydrogenase, decarboxylating [Annulohypoxylon maeteangense]
MAPYPNISQINRIGIVGAGNMGTMMSFGFSENGLDVSLWDVSEKNVDAARKIAGQTKTMKGKFDYFKDIHEFTKSLDSQPRKIFIFSVTHGWPADAVLEKISDDLKEGDIVLDGGNENYRNTERRQKELEKRGVKWIGMGVSGGYQSARRGPSMSPGGDREAIEFVLPLLEKFSAKSAVDGKPCVQYMGPRGAGHYVKMVHNGIENGMLSAVCEAWNFLHKSLGLPYDEIGRIFGRWNSEGELRNTYLIQIGSEICQTKKTPQGDMHGEGKGESGYVLDDVLDKVVQDDDNSEGTLFWTVKDAADRHVSAPTITAGHFFRVASGNRAQRLKVVDKLQVPKPQRVDSMDKENLIENLRRAVYASFLCSYCQGLELIARASRDEHWDINLGKCIQIWRAGCIIQEDHIADMLEPILLNAKEPIMNMKLIDEVASELRSNFDALKLITLKAIEWDNYVPAISASLEYLKYVGGGMLATQFMEAEMDFFGAHAYDRPNVRGEDPGKPSKGAHHYEWRPAVAV